MILTQKPSPAPFQNRKRAEGFNHLRVKFFYCIP